VPLVLVDPLGLVVEPAVGQRVVERFRLEAVDEEQGLVRTEVVERVADDREGRLVSVAHVEDCVGLRHRSGIRPFSAWPLAGTCST